MKTCAFPVITALVFSLFCSPLAAQNEEAQHIDHRSPLAPVDLALRGAEADVYAFDLSAADAGRRDAAMCGADFTMDKAMAVFAPGKLPSWAAPETDRILLSAVGYYQCRAYVAKDRALCAPLKAFTLSYDSGTWSGDPDGGAHWDLGCFGRMNEIALVREFITRSPDFAKLCKPSLLATQEFEDAEFANSDIDRVCSIIVEHGREPDVACKALQPLYKEAEDAGSCLPMLRRLQGDPGACAGQHSIEADERCRSYVAFRKAFDAKDAKLCAGLPICSILMGGGADSCRPYVETFQGLFCASPSARLERLDSELRAADAAFAGLSGSADPALPGLRKRRAVLQSRFERIKKNLGGGAPAAAE